MIVNVHIDAMTEADVLAVAAIDPSTHMEETQLRDEFARPWAHLWVAREGGDAEVVAFLVSWHVADELHVLNLTTRPDRRRRGIGRALIETAVAYGRAKHVKHVLLEVRRSNRGAIALYRATGFFATGVRPRYYPDNEDAVEMALVFDQGSGTMLVRDDAVVLD